VIPAGHRLAFRFANNAGGTVPALTGGSVQLGTGEDASRILVPVVGETGDDETSGPGGPARGRPGSTPPRGRR
jgi:hypothetical protein